MGALLLRIILTHLQVSPWILYTELPTRMDSLLAGALLALALRGPRPDLWLSRRMLYPLLSGCCLVQAALFIRARTLFFSSSAMTSWGYSMTAGVYFCVLALALVPGTMPNRVGRIPVASLFRSIQLRPVHLASTAVTALRPLASVVHSQHPPTGSWADSLHHDPARNLNCGGGVKLPPAGAAVSQNEVAFSVPGTQRRGSGPALPEPTHCGRRGTNLREAWLFVGGFSYIGGGELSCTRNPGVANVGAQYA